MMKLPKKLLIAKVREAQIRLHAAEHFIDESSRGILKLDSQQKAVAEWNASKL